MLDRDNSRKQIKIAPSTQFFGLLVAVALIAVTFPSLAETPEEDVESIAQAGFEAYRKTDHAKALPLLGQAAEMGHPKAQSYLAYQMWKAAEFELAFDWYKKSAENGYPEGMYGLAGMYAAGEGAEVDFEQAFLWYQKSAEAGFVTAQVALAAAWEEGAYGLEPDNEHSMKWYRTAADQGHKPALRRLMLAYENGELGLLADAERAAYWRQKLEELDQRQADEAESSIAGGESR